MKQIQRAVDNDSKIHVTHDTPRLLHSPADGVKRVRITVRVNCVRKKAGETYDFAPEPIAVWYETELKLPDKLFNLSIGVNDILEK